MKYFISTINLFIFLLLSTQACTQNIPDNRAKVQDEDFDEKISGLINFTVPTIGVTELHNIQNEVFIFDTRKWEEYEVSHIPGAKYLGYGDFEASRMDDVPKDAPIVLYCSIGYRSEKIGEKLQALGFTNVSNLYGSIFEWVNHDYKIVDKYEKPTRKLHTYNRNWSKWVDEKKAEKTW
ncbi:MAG: hypothetical protein DHS20C18_07490 [Saprospiraceae bacterium]|nr:MAG: hypothetical protein DHS20C18_07490 [Saprospiraceae bacterium]